MRSVVATFFVAQGTLTSRLQVTDGFGRVATTTRQYFCLSLRHTYGWQSYANDPPMDRRQFLPRRISFKPHEGAFISGHFTEPRKPRENRSIPFTGTLTGDRDIRIVLDGGAGEFNGEIFLNVPLGESYIKLIGDGGMYGGKTFVFEYYDPF